MNLIQYKVISIEIHIIHSLHIFVINKYEKCKKWREMLCSVLVKCIFNHTLHYELLQLDFFYVVVKECSILQFALLNKIPIFSTHGQPPYSYTLGEFIMNTFKSSSSISRIKKT